MDLLDELEKSSMDAAERIVKTEDEAPLTPEELREEFTRKVTFYIYVTQKPLKRLATEISFIDSLFAETTLIDHYVISRIYTNVKEREDISNLAQEVEIDVPQYDDDHDRISAAVFNGRYEVTVHFSVGDTSPREYIKWITSVCRFLKQRPFDAYSLKFEEWSLDSDLCKPTEISRESIDKIAGCDDNSSYIGYDARTKVLEIYDIFAPLPCEDERKKYPYSDERLTKAMFYHNYRKKINELRRNGYIQDEIVVYKNQLAYDAIRLTGHNIVELARKMYLLSSVIENDTAIVRNIDSWFLRRDMDFYNGVIKHRSNPMSDFSLMFDTAEHLKKYCDVKVNERNFIDTVKSIEDYINSIDFEQYELSSNVWLIEGTLKNKIAQLFTKDVPLQMPIKKLAYADVDTGIC